MITGIDKESNQFPSLTTKYCDQSKLISCPILKIREILLSFPTSFYLFMLFVGFHLSTTVKWHDNNGKVCKKWSELILQHFTNDDEILSIANMYSLVSLHLAGNSTSQVSYQYIHSMTPKQTEIPIISDNLFQSELTFPYIVDSLGINSFNHIILLGLETKVVKGSGKAWKEIRRSYLWASTTVAWVLKVENISVT